MGEKKEKDSQRFQSKGTKYFCTKFAKFISILCVLLLQIAWQKSYNKNTSKSNMKSKSSKGLKNPAPHIDDILQILCPFLGVVTPKSSLSPEAVLSC